MIDPQAQHVMATLAQQGAASISQVGPVKARQTYLIRKALTQPTAIAVGAIRDLQIPGPAGPIPARLYSPSTPQDTPSGLTVYFHGGGFVIGSIETHDTLCRSLCERSGHAVLSIDYRLAPEHPFPAAFEDAVAATQWVRQTGFVDLGIDPNRIAVAGDSAGGQLSAVVALALRDLPGPALVFQLLAYPVTDLLMRQASIQTLGSGYMLTKSSLECYYDLYCPNHHDRHDWRASPLYASDLSNLPPSLVITAGFDPLRDEGLAYANRLSQSGTPTQYLCFERQMHAFLPMGGAIDEANFAVDVCALALRRALQA